MFDRLGGDNTIIKTKGRDSRMEQMLKDYEQTIKDIEVRIKELKEAIKKPMPVKELHKLEWRIAALSEERLDMMHICWQMREHLAPKTPAPDRALANASGEN